MLILQTYTLLCKSDVERAEWKEAIIPLLEQTQGKNRSINTIIIVYIYCVELLIKEDSNMAYTLTSESIFTQLKAILN